MIEQTPQGPAVLVHPVAALVREAEPGTRAGVASRRLIRLVSELSAQSHVAIDLRSTIEPGRLQLSFELGGDAPFDIADADLAAAVVSAVELGEAVETTVAAPQLAVAFELVRTSVSPMFRRQPEADPSVPEWAAKKDVIEGPVYATPLPSDGDSAEELLEALTRAGQPVHVRTVLMPADELSAGMVVDELRASLGHHELAAYARVPVRARTVVASPSEIPAAVRAALRQRGTGLQLVPIDPAEARMLWSDPARALRSAALGETHALAITRIPAAGAQRALGIATRPPAVQDRPLDPVPAHPERPVRWGRATDVFGQPVDAVQDGTDLPRHAFVEGITGSGKTMTLVQLMWSLNHAGIPVICLDPHGDGAARAAAYSLVRDQPTHYIRHGDREHPVRINPFAEEDAEMRERMLTDLLELIQVMLDPRHEGFVGERFKRSFTIVAQACFTLWGPRTSITDVAAIFASKTSLADLAMAVMPRSRDLARQLQSELLSLGEKEFGELVSWFVSRLQPFLRTPALRQILGTGADSVDMLEVIDSGSSLIIDLASPQLGAEVSRMLGALWLLKVRAAMGRRADRSRPVVLLVDEAHLYTFGALPGLLAEARKFGIGIIVATQSADNLHPQLAAAIEANCGSFVSLRSGRGAALAASMRLGGWSPSELTRLPDLTAAATLSRDGVPTEAFTLHIDHLERAAAAGWTDERIAKAADRLAERSQVELCEPHAELGVLSDFGVAAAVHTAAEEAKEARRPSVGGRGGQPRPGMRSEPGTRTAPVPVVRRQPRDVAASEDAAASRDPSSVDVLDHWARAHAEPQ